MNFYGSAVAINSDGKLILLKVLGIALGATAHNRFDMSVFFPFWLIDTGFNLATISTEK